MKLNLKNELGFKRTNRYNVDKQPATEYKDWVSACGNFRIRWHCVFQSVRVRSSYYALRLDRRNVDGQSFWNFALPNERRPYRTFKKAVLACFKAAGIIGTRATRSDKGKSRVPLAERIHKMQTGRLAKAKLQSVVAERQESIAKAAERAEEAAKAEAAAIAAAMPKKRGRPAGSKNKTKEDKPKQKKRRQRSDKGKKRGPRKCSNESSTG